MTTFSGGNAFSTLGASQIQQIQPDWDAVAGPAYVKNKPTNLSQFDDDLGISKVGFSGQYNDILNPPTELSQFTDNLGISKVGFSGSYPDLLNRPSIPTPQVQSNWTETVTTSADYILNKPALAPVATSGAYGSLTGIPIGAVFNNGIFQPNVRLWTGTATTNSGVATFHPTSDGTASGTALFTTILNVQSSGTFTNNSSATTVPSTAVASNPTPSGVYIVAVTASGAIVPNGSVIYALILGI